MFHYIISWSDGFESSGSYVMWSENKYTHHEFQDLILSIAPEVIQTAADSSNKEDNEKYGLRLSPSSFHGQIGEILAEKHGFHFLDYQAGYGLCGFEFKGIGSDENSDKIAKIANDMGYKFRTQLDENH